MFFAFTCKAKSFVSTFLLFSRLSFSLQRFWIDWQKFLASVSSVVAVSTCNQYRKCHQKGKILSCLKGRRPIQLLNAIATWSWKIKWQAKTNISSLSQCLWPPNLAEWWQILRGSFPWRHIALKDILKQIWKSPYMFVFMEKQLPNHFAFLILRILKLFVHEFCKFRKKYANF